MKKLVVLGSLAALAVMAIVATTAFAGGGHDKDRGRFAARMSGYQEIIPANPDATIPVPEGGAVSTTGRGHFSARLRNDPLRLEFELEWDDLEGTDVLFAHIHFGQLGTVGGVSAFLCGGGGKPACADGGSGSAEGTINIADVVGPAGQGIEAGALEELIRAMRHGATYANLHTNKWPSGEIRGQINHGFKGHFKRKK